MKIYINGNLVDKNDAKISIFDRGYLFGEGLFETIRSYNGQIPFLEKHLDRMEWSATFMGINFIHPREIKEAIEKTMEVNKLKNARIKIILTMNNSDNLASSPPDENMQPNLVVMADSLVPLEDEVYEKGEEMVVIVSVKNDPAPVSTMKSISWLTKIMAMKEISEKEVFDGVFLDANGFVTETTKANLFWVKNEKIFTPPVNIGLLPGITRKLIIDGAKENGYVVSEKMIKVEELKTADEIFITNSIIEVVPITFFDEAAVGNEQVGKITKDVMEIYKERIKEEME